MPDIDLTSPDNALQIFRIPEELRGLKETVQESLDVDHDFGTEGGTGEHNQVTLINQGNPTQAADRYIVFSKEIGGNGELYGIDSSGRVVRITLDGTINLAEGLLTNNDVLRGQNSSSVVRSLLKINTSNVMELGDSASSGIKIMDSLDCNKQTVSNFVIEVLSSDPASPVNGQMWLRS